MNQDEFLKIVKEKYAKTTTDSVLIECMCQIRDYFSELKSKMPDIDGELSVGFDSNVADTVIIDLFENRINFQRVNESIRITYVSSKDNEFTKKYAHLDLTEIAVKNNVLIDTSSQKEFEINSLENYLKFLLA